MENKGDNKTDVVKRLMKVMVAPIVWDKRMKGLVVSGIEKVTGDKLTDKEIRIAKAAWCHGFSADPIEVMDKTLEDLNKEDGGNTDD